MANIRLIKGRIKTAKNIAQITKAMELVAASKMKKAQAQALQGKLYATKIYKVVMKLATRADYVHHPLLSRPKQITGKRMVILLSTNKGLCGGLNTNLFRFVMDTYNDVKSLDIVCLGKKGTDFAVRLGKSVVADFSTTVPFTLSVAPITELVKEKFLSGGYDGIDLVYNEFLSALKQSPKKKTILPLTLEVSPEEGEEKTLPFVVEPTIAHVFDALLPHYLENQIRDAILQAAASEHSARMVAMRNATDNAMGLKEELTLIYNKARQEKITYEITDMVTARLASES